MELTNEYQEIDNIVSFSFNHEFLITPRFRPTRTKFCTIYEASMVEWEVSIDRQRAIRRNPRMPIEQLLEYQIRMVEMGRRDVCPPIYRILLRLTVFSENEVMDKSEIYRFHQLMTANNQNPRQRPQYLTDPSCEFGKFLTNLFDNPVYIGKRVELEIVVEYEKNEMVSKNFVTPSNVIENVPMELDYTFDSLVNSDRFDFKIRTLNGTAFRPTNKEVLCIASDYFREQIQENMTELNTEVEHLESLDTVLTFMITGKYKAVERMTPNLANEMIVLCNLWKCCDLRLFRNAVERHCYEELVNNSEDLGFLVNMSIMSQDRQLSNLFSSCISLIINTHLTQFFEDYIRRNHALKEKLVARIGSRISVVSCLKQCYFASFRVRRFVRYQPIYAEE